MAYRRSSRYGSRASAGYGRRRASGFVRRAAAPRRRARASGRLRRGAREQTIRFVIEQAPASGISRANERVLAKMNPLPGKAKL